MFGVDHTCQWGKVGAEGIEGVPDVVTDAFLVEAACEEVVPILVQGFGAGGARLGPVLGAEDWQSEFPLVHGDKGVGGESVGLVAAVVGGEGKAGGVGKDVGEG